MFEIGFLELVVVGMVALVVLGPERLPGAIRTISLWIGRLRRSFNTIKQDIEREIGADEIRRQLRNEAIMDKFKQTRSQVQDTIDTVKKETAELRKSADLESQAAAFVNQSTATGSEANNKSNTSASAEPAGTGTPAAPTPAAPQPATDTTKSES